MLDKYIKQKNIIPIIQKSILSFIILDIIQTTVFSKNNNGKNLIFITIPFLLVL